MNSNKNFKSLIKLRKKWSNKKNIGLKFWERKELGGKKWNSKASLDDYDI